jgi:GNAT superfamily N-acetyltransferase
VIGALHEDSGSFLEAIGPQVAADPAGWNLLATIVGSVADGSRSYPRVVMATVSDGGQVCGAALRTAPYRIVLSPCEPAAATALGQLLGHVEPDAWGVSGPALPLGAFTSAYLAAAGRGDERLDEVMRMTLYVLGDYRPRRQAGVSLRRATADDAALVLDLTARFAAETGVFAPALTIEEMQARLAATTTILAEVDGVNAGLAGHAPIVDFPGGSAGRIGPVYTSPEWRGRGIGSALTSAIIDALHGDGADLVLLYADAGYAPSNATYVGLGFVPVGEFVDRGQIPA